MTIATSTKGIYKFFWDCGRQGDLEGIFVATAEEVADRLGKEISFGEALGKHSYIHGPLEASDVTLITDNPEFVKLFEDHGMSTGHNPLEVQYQDESGEWVDPE